MPGERLERRGTKSEPRSQIRDLVHPTLEVGSNVGQPPIGIGGGLRRSTISLLSYFLDRLVKNFGADTEIFHFAPSFCIIGKS